MDIIKMKVMQFKLKLKFSWNIGKMLFKQKSIHYFDIPQTPFGKGGFSVVLFLSKNT